VTLFCLIHKYDDKTDLHLFKSEKTVEPGEVAAQLNVDFLLCEMLMMLTAL